MEEIHFLDALRNESRSVYSLNIFSNTHQLQKLINLLKEQTTKFLYPKTIRELINRILVNMKKKLEIIQEHSVLTYNIESIDSYRIASAVKEGDFSIKSVRASSRSLNVTMLGTANDNVDHSLTPKKTNCKLTSMDLRKVAMVNYAKKFGRKTSFNPNLCFSSNSAPEANSPVNFGNATSSLDESWSSAKSQDITTKYLSKSVILIRQKPFNMTEEEELIEAIFKGFKKPLLRKCSFEEELMIDHCFEEDKRLNNSCVIDYYFVSHSSKFRKLRAHSIGMNEEEKIEQEDVKK